jgi:very-short-patch-repair endonuclease
VVARRQLLEIGFDEDGVKLRMDSGRLHPLHGEVYAVGHADLSQQGRWLAAVLAYGDRALLSHRSAAALWGLMEPRSHAVDVTAPAGRQGVRRRPKIWIHRGRLDPEDRATRAAIPVTTVARTLFDFAEVIKGRRLESAWEEADRLGLLDIRAVERVCERGFGRRALKPIRRLLSETHAAEPTRSSLEEDFASFCRERRLPMPSFNAMALNFMVDALWSKARVAAELDSWEFHHHQAAFERDRARDSALQAAGYRTIRITHRRLHREPDVLADQLRTLLGRV